MPDPTSSGIQWAPWIAAIAAWAGVVWSWLRSGKGDKTAESALAVDIDTAVSNRIAASGIETMAKQAVKDAKEAKELVALDKQALLFSIKRDLTRIDEILGADYHRLLEAMSTELVYRVSTCTDNVETAALVQDAYAAIKAFNTMFAASTTPRDRWVAAWRNATRVVPLALEQIENDDAFNRACTRREETGTDE